MGDFYSHADQPSKETKQRMALESAANQRADLDRINVWIQDNLETMNYEELHLIYEITERVEEYKIFFKVLKELK